MILSVKKTTAFCLTFVILTIFIFTTQTKSEGNYRTQDLSASETINTPSFYRGIYLHVYSAKKMDRLVKFVKKAKESGINTFVMDVQAGKNASCAVPQENIQYCKDNGFYVIARVVCFQDGLKQYPVPEEIINNRIQVAEESCKKGFDEIQFDYIRFNDYKVSKKLSFQEKYDFIENILQKAKDKLKPYNVKIAADIFGRIPLNTNDAIGQKMEVFDRVVDVICPMAYPSHYTWSEKMMSDPYYTVFKTSKSAKERVKNAEIVTYIQAFKMKIQKSNMTYEKYIEEQVKAVQDADVKGFILWNAAQEYDVPLKVVGDFYKSSKEAMNKKNDEKSS